VSFKFISILQIVTAFQKRLQAAPESIFVAACVSRLNQAIPLENNGRRAKPPSYRTRKSAGGKTGTPALF
jgi:hypothetical protein